MYVSSVFQSIVAPLQYFGYLYAGSMGHRRGEIKTGSGRWLLRKLLRKGTFEIFDYTGYAMPTHYVNMDALIRREDFEVESEKILTPAQLASTMQVSQLEPVSLMYQVLRKPDFQRETANWEPEKVAELIESFLEGDLIPSRISWRSPKSGNIFVIDGAHRLSAFIAWVHDDYSDRQISIPFFANMIPPEQIRAAEKTRQLIKENLVHIKN